MDKRSGVLDSIERLGYITHPNIAARIVIALGLGVEQYNGLVHECHKADTLPEWKDPPDKLPRHLDKYLRHI